MTKTCKKNSSSANLEEKTRKFRWTGRSFSLEHLGQVSVFQFWKCAEMMTHPRTSATGWRITNRQKQEWCKMAEMPTLLRWCHDVTILLI